MDASLDMPTPAVLRYAKDLTRDDVRRELQQIGLKPTGILAEDVENLQVEFTKQYEAQVASQREAMAAAEARLAARQADLREKAQAAKDLREEAHAIAQNPRFELFIRCCEQNKTNLDATFSGSTAPMARSLRKALTDPVCSSLTALDLSHSQLGDDGGRAIAEILHTNNVILKLELEHCALAHGAAAAFGEALVQNSGLSFLSLENNSLTSDRRELDGVRSLASSLAENSTLTALNIARADLGPEGGALVAEALGLNSSIIILNLEHNVGMALNDLQTIARKLDANRAQRALLDARLAGERREKRAEDRVQAVEDARARKEQKYQEEVEQRSHDRNSERMSKLNEERAAKSAALQEARLAAYAKHEAWVEAEAAASKKKKKKKK